MVIDLKNLLYIQSAYPSSVVECFGPMWRRSASICLRLILAKHRLSHRPNVQLFTEVYNCYIPMFGLILLSRRRVKLLPYSCHDLGFLLQNLERSLIDATKPLQELAAHDCPLSKIEATVWGSYEELPLVCSRIHCVWRSALPLDFNSASCMSESVR